ncbi:HAUS augmin-like complex subunit 2 isoform X2 [Betta splendens]|uniref:HAUS augmin-like complex subunit 2 isoform X2 n=1 Tax=Betta splendens TaxID=158456 RepID=A0A6P7LNX6_BETSP|nr:HAUS augmin-like complex subunit 2 isoform X2 [Betta splendens]
MLQWDLSPFSVTPAASVLARCVSRGALSQEEIESVSSRPTPAFSPHLHEAEQRFRTQRQLDQLQLEMQLLQMEKQDNDITHTFYLTQRFQMVQIFCSHLQDVLKDHTRLRQRLMRPLGRTNLPVQAQLHRSVVNSVKVLLDFIETLEEKLKLVHSWTKTRDLLVQLDTSMAQLLAQVVELQTLSSQVFQWREVGSSLRSDGSA